MLKITKSLLFLSLIFTFALALQDGDTIALKTRGNFFNANFQYLNAGTVDGSVSMAANTDYATVSGTWWRVHLLSDGSWAFESLGNIPNAQHVYLNANTHDGSVNLAPNTDYNTASGTHWVIDSLSDGTITLRTLGSFPNPDFVYLNTNTYDGSVNLAASTDYATASGTHWEIDFVTSANGSAPSGPGTGGGGIAPTGGDNGGNAPTGGAGPASSPKTRRLRSKI